MIVQIEEMGMEVGDEGGSHKGAEKVLGVMDVFITVLVVIVHLHNHFHSQPLKKSFIVAGEV